MNQRLFSLSLFTAAVILLSACYRMPTDNDFCTIPTTNNPSVTCEKNDNIMPAMKY